MYHLSEIKTAKREYSALRDIVKLHCFKRSCYSFSDRSALLHDPKFHSLIQFISLFCKFSLNFIGNMTEGRFHITIIENSLRFDLTECAFHYLYTIETSSTLQTEQTSIYCPKLLVVMDEMIPGLKIVKNDKEF